MDINQSFPYGYKSNKANQTRLLTQTRIRQTKESPAEQEPKSVELKPGQTIKGEVVDLRYQEVKIRLEPEQQVITARLSGEVSLSIGQEAHFQVTGDTDGRITLKYLPEAPMPYLEQTIKKALEASGLPLNERNRALVLELLNNKMPIDKQTLALLAKASILNREAAPQSLVLMYKNHIPLTSANIRQFEAYQNGSHQLLADIRLLTKNITELLRQAVPPKDGPPIGYASSLPVNSNGIPGTITGGQSGALSEAVIGGQSGALSEAVIGGQSGALSEAVIGGQSATLSGQSGALSEAVIGGQSGNELDFIPKGQPITGTEVIPGGIGDVKSETILKQNSLLNTEGFSTGVLDILRLLSEAMADHPELTGKLSYQELTVGELLGKEGLEQLSRLIEQSITSNSQLPAKMQVELLTSLKNGAASISAFLQQVNQVFGKGLIAQLTAAGETATGKPVPYELHSLLEEVFRQKWTITPEKLAKKSPLEDLYRDLQEDLRQLNNLINSNKDATEETRLQSPVKALQDNLQFMKELNELYPYVQLPIQFKNQEVHGDLYVFHRKNALQGKKDSFSVLLHLDMSELGALNIHLKMELDKLQATFFIEDPASGRLISEHLSELSQALSLKGYHLQVRVEQPEHKSDFIKDILEQEQADSSTLRYSFDIRA